MPDILQHRPIPKMEDVLDQVGFEWRGDEKLQNVLHHLWTITAFHDKSVRILLDGATGTGKELLANAIHQFVGGDPGAIHVVNCAQLNPDRATADLFGAIRGAYTGLQKDRIGSFELASSPHSTLFLDEVHKLSPDVRTQLYRVLHEKTFQRMGDPSQTLQFHGHVVSAASSSLDGMIDDGSFPQDLLSRLSQTDEIHIPSFDARTPEHRRLVVQYGFDHWLASGMQHDSAVEEALLQVKFPGNIRDLRSYIEQLSAYARRDAYIAGHFLEASVSMQHFADVRVQPKWHNLSEVKGPMVTPMSSSDSIFVPSAPVPTFSTHLSLDEVEIRHIVATLETNNWNKSQSCVILGIERSTLDRKLKRYGILRPVEPDQEAPE